MKGSGHQNFMNSFEYGKTLPDSSFQFQVNNWNHYPIQPLDIYKYKVACHRRSKRANKALLRYVFPGWPQNFGRVAFSSSFPFASKRINNCVFIVDGVILWVFSSIKAELLFVRTGSRGNFSCLCIFFRKQCKILGTS